LLLVVPVFSLLVFVLVFVFVLVVPIICSGDTRNI